MPADSLTPFTPFSLRARLGKNIERQKKPRARFRGVPPPLPFDIATLPNSTLLNETEAAAAIRRSKSTLKEWRKIPEHPLIWRRVAGRVLYELPPLRALLKGDSK